MQHITQVTNPVIQMVESGGSNAIDEAENTLQFQLNVQRARRRALTLKREQLSERQKKIAKSMQPIASKRRQLHELFLRKKQQSKLANLTTDPDSWALISGMVFVLSIGLAITLTRDIVLIATLAVFPTAIACGLMLMFYRRHLAEWDAIEDQREEALSTLQRSLHSLEQKNDRLLKKIRKVEAHISQCDNTMLRLQQI